MKKLITLFLFLVLFSPVWAQNKNTAQATDTLSVTVNPPLLCFPDTCAILTADVKGGMPPYTYIWPTGEKTQSIRICSTTPTSFKVLVKDNNGTAKEAEVTVTVGARPTVNAVQDLIGCAGSSTFLSASGADTYLWSIPGSSATGPNVRLSLSQETPITVIGTTADGCSDTVVLIGLVHPAPIVKITGKTTICLGESTTLTVSGPPQKFYYWQPDKTNGKSVTITPITTITELVIVMDTNGCVGVDSVTVHVVPCTSIEEQNTSSNQFNVYPNPFTTAATLSFTTEQKNATFILMDMLGKEVRSTRFSGEQLLLEKGDLKAGIYFIRILSENEMYSEKILIH